VTKQRRETEKLRQRARRARITTEQRVAQQTIQRARSDAYVSPKYLSAVKEMDDLAEVEEFYLGPFDKVCQACNALHFEGERTLPNKQFFSSCCSKGKVKLPPLSPVPEYIKYLLTTNDPCGKIYRENIIHYNASMAIASRTCKLIPSPPYGHYSMTIHGQAYYNMGSLRCEEGRDSSYAQLYILDAKQALEQRMRFTYNSKCDPVVMQTLDEIIRQENPFVSLFKRMDQVNEEARTKTALENVPYVDPKMYVCHSGVGGRYNEPVSTAEMAVLFASADETPPDNLHFCVYPRHSSHGLIILHHCNPDRDPLIYPLLFPKGDRGE
jgi:hypothetical protein